jgi:hypothetical protein
MPLYLAAAFLPLVPGIASITDALGDVGWGGITPSLVRAVTADALLYTAAVVVLAAPLAGVWVASHRRRPFEPAIRLGLATAIFCAVSATLTAARLGEAPGSLLLVLTSHAVLGCVTLALAALGAAAGTLLRDPLDAAALAVGVALLAGFGVLVAGAPVARLPPPALEAALLASPILTVATAAHVDLVRSDIWYQISPLAHGRLDYPAWTTVCGVYLLAGAAGFGAIGWSGRGRVPEPKELGL